MTSAPTGVNFKKLTDEEVKRLFCNRKGNRKGNRKSNKINNKTVCRICEKSVIVTKGMCDSCNVKAGLEYINLQLNKENRPIVKRATLSHRVAVLKRRAKKNGLPFDLTTDDYMKLWTEQEGKCALTGRVMTFGKRLGTSLDNASMDRIDAGKGYVLGNVRLVTVQANSARGIGNDQDLFEFCEDVMSWFLTKDNRLRREMK